jgi:hypothetical protein
MHQQSKHIPAVTFFQGQHFSVWFFLQISTDSILLHFILFFKLLAVNIFAIGLCKYHLQLACGRGSMSEAT